MSSTDLGYSGKYKRENQRSETEMVRTAGEKDRGRCSNENMEVSGQRKIGIPKLRWSDVIRKDTKEKGVKREEEQHRRTWRMKTRSVRQYPVISINYSSIKCTISK